MWYRVFIILCLLVFSQAVFAEDTHLRIVYVSKMTEVKPADNNCGGLAELGTLVKQVRENYTYSLFLNGGDFLAPSTLSSFDHGTHMIDILNSIVPEVVAVNERELAYQEDELVLRVSEAAFPFIASNVVDPLTGSNLQGLSDHQCFTFGGKQVCILGLLDPNVSTTYLTDRIIVDSSMALIKQKAEKLRAEGADFIILLSSFELDGDSLLGGGIVDLIYESTENASCNRFGDKMYIRQGSSDCSASIVDVVFKEDGGYAEARSEVKLKDYAPDTELSVKINYYLARLSSIMDVEVGKTAEPMNTDRVAVRTAENGFANLIVDALRAYYGADLALVNGGSIRGNRQYEEGYLLTRRDIQGELPFRNSSKLISITGSQIIQSLENGLSKVEDVKGGFPHVSGMSYTYCSKEPAGQRVRSVTINGKPLVSGKKYTLATVDYLANGGDGYSALRSAIDVKTTKNPQLLWEVVREFINNKKVIKPVIEGRIKDICSGN